MKIPKILLLGFLFASHVAAEPETNQSSSIAGKWKLSASQFENEPLLPAWCSIIGEIEFKPDGSFFSWVQAQSGDSGKIQPGKGTWELHDRNLVMILEGHKSQESCTIDLEDNKLIIKQDSPEYAELHYKRAIDDLGDTEIEGLKFDYRISFPSHWKVILPESFHELPEEGHKTLEAKKIRAMAISPDNESVITLFVSSRKRTFDNIDIKDGGHMRSSWIKTEDTGGQQWRIQKARNLRKPPGFDVYIASTYYYYKTIILNFEFLGEHSNAENVINRVINSYTVLEKDNEHDLELGKLIPHTCGEPIIYRFADPDNPEASVIHFLYDGDICPQCGKSLKE